jgi:nucleotide-binding universal stress UspA family protein
VGGTILCDVTDSLAGRSAGEYAHALAARLGLRVVLVFVIDGAVAARESVTGRQRQSGAEQTLAATADELGGAETRLAFGDHAEVLATVAAEEGADLVILGSRAVGFGGRNLRCGLVRHLEAATPVPVLIAPPSTRRRSERRPAIGAASS